MLRACQAESKSQWDLLKILLSVTDTFDQASMDSQTIPMKDVAQRHASFDSLQSTVFENLYSKLLKIFLLSVKYMQI